MMLFRAAVVAILLIVQLPAGDADASSLTLRGETHVADDREAYIHRKLKKGKATKGLKGKSSKGCTSNAPFFDADDICSSEASSSADDADRQKSPYAELYKKVFEEFYQNWHCVQGACDGIEVGSDIDNQPGMNYNGLGQGVCLLQQFHCDLCPSKELACSCDGNRVQKPESPDDCGTNKCIQRLGTLERTAIVEYCEDMLDEQYFVPDITRRNLAAIEGRELGPDCSAPGRRLDADRRLGPACEVNYIVEACTRYISAEGYACCPFEEKCEVHELSCERNRNETAFQDTYCPPT